MRKYSTVRASAKELGGMMQTSDLQVHEAVGVEVLGVDDGRVDVGEDLELVGAADVVAVARGAVGDHPPGLALAHLSGLEGLDHAVLGGHAADPAVGLDGHGGSSCALTAMEGGSATPTVIVVPEGRPVAGIGLADDRGTAARPRAAPTARSPDFQGKTREVTPAGATGQSSGNLAGVIETDVVASNIRGWHPELCPSSGRRSR